MGDRRGGDRFDSIFVWVNAWKAPTEINSLFDSKKFPVHAEKFPVFKSREFDRKSLNAGADLAAKTVKDKKSRNLPCKFPC